MENKLALFEIIMTNGDYETNRFKGIDVKRERRQKVIITA